MMSSLNWSEDLWTKCLYRYRNVIHYKSKWPCDLITHITYWCISLRAAFHSWRHFELLSIQWGGYKHWLVEPTTTHKHLHTVSCSCLQSTEAESVLICCFFSCKIRELCHGKCRNVVKVEREQNWSGSYLRTDVFAVSRWNRWIAVENVSLDR